MIKCAAILGQSQLWSLRASPQTDTNKKASICLPSVLGFDGLELGGRLPRSCFSAPRFATQFITLDDNLRCNL